MKYMYLLYVYRPVTGALSQEVAPTEEEQTPGRVRRRIIVDLRLLIEVALKLLSLLPVQREYNSFIDCKAVIKLFTRNHVIL